MTQMVGKWSPMVGALMLALGCACAAFAQDDEPGVRARSLWNKRFQEARAKQRQPEGNQLAAGNKRTPPSKPPRAKQGVPIEGELIGVTLWRLRPAMASDDARIPRLVVQKSSGQSEAFCAERAGASQVFSEGELVRMGIEVARESKGYLYIINREVFADGRLSEPYLIFPSSTTRAGGNVVTAGRIVYLPADGDKLPYFTIQRRAADKTHVGEKLTIIISPQPLSPRGKRIKLDERTEITELDPAQVAEWERQWGGAVEQRETKGQLVKAWTLAEKRAGEGEGLGEDDPLPQMIYRVKNRTGTPALAHVFVRVAP